MIIFLLFVINVFATVHNTTGVITRDDLTSFNKNFTSAPHSYRIQNVSNINDFHSSSELFERKKCKTCCRVMIASEWNYKEKRKFTYQDDQDNHQRFVMDMEFDDKRSLRKCDGNYEYCQDHLFTHTHIQ